MQNKLGLVLLGIYCNVVLSQNVRTFEKPSDWQSKISTSLSGSYKIGDVNGVGRQFDGIGGLSGGGATSRLLMNYAEPYRSHILDFLFKPNFGASLHILKVEIGGDGQSTEGTEASHMRNANDENYTRGYEWWLMKEAKSRNPNIKLVGLPWAFPGWIGQGTVWPYKNREVTAQYITKWVLGAKSEHNLAIDYVGIWNERPFDVEYIKTLRRTLNSAGLSHVQIIADDGSVHSAISYDIMHDQELAEAVAVIGTHYPGTVSSKTTKSTGKPIWASEDYSTFNDVIGAGCWARILNQNLVNGNMTATIAWNLITSYYNDLPYKRCSLMTANQPWSGNYVLDDPLWVTSHTTQFAQPGWKYLQTVGHLSGGGSYVALTDQKGNLTIIIETMSHDQSICIRPPLPAYTVEDQNATFVLEGSFKGKVTKMHMWFTQLGQSGNRDVFLNKGSVAVDKTGQVSIHLPIDSVITLSTITTAMKGSYPTPPAPAEFPLPYSDSFDKTPGFSEPFNFADQAGSYETFHNNTSDDGHEWTFRQVVEERPVTWCSDPNQTITVIGNYKWSHITVEVSIKSESTYGAFVAMRVDKGGCDAREARGVYFWLMKNGSIMLTSDLTAKTMLEQCYFYWECFVADYSELGWNKVKLTIDSSNKIYAYLNGKLALEHTITKDSNIPDNGFVALGTSDYGTAQFDDFSVTSA
ncbi:galactocerebrosidase [Ciona intestinalis]